jgi:S1-C subfamily serine protease
MSIVTVFTNKCIGKAFAISIDSKIYLITVAHIIENPIKIGKTKVSVVYSSTGDDMALLSAPPGFSAIALADEHDTEELVSYSDLAKSLDLNKSSDLAIMPGDSGSPVLKNGKCVAMVAGTSFGFGCIIPVEKIHKFIQQFQKLSTLSKLDLPKLPSIQFSKTNAKNNQSFCEI